MGQRAVLFRVSINPRARCVKQAPARGSCLWTDKDIGVTGAVLCCQNLQSALCDQLQWRNFIPHCTILRGDDGLKTIVAFPAAPKMTILLATSILGPFGGNQLVAALKAAHSKGRTTIGYHRRHGNLPKSLSPTNAFYHNRQSPSESLLLVFFRGAVST